MVEQPAPLVNSRGYVVTVNDIYAAPKSTVDGRGPSQLDVSVADGHIVGHSPIVLPRDVCIDCGSTEAGGQSRDTTLVYIPTWSYFLVVLTPLVVFVVQLFLKKRVEITYYVCPQCGRRRHQRRWLGVGINAVSIALLIGGIVLEQVGFFAASGLGFVALLWLKRRQLRAAGHDEGQFSIEVDCPKVLEHLKASQKAHADDGCHRPR